MKAAASVITPPAHYQQLLQLLSSALMTALLFVQIFV